jgi:hypothetical protein
MHPAIAHVWPDVADAHLPPPLQAVSKPFHDLAQALIKTLPAQPSSGHPGSSSFLVRATWKS